MIVTSSYRAVALVYAPLINLYFCLFGNDCEFLSLFGDELGEFLWISGAWLITHRCHFLNQDGICQRFIDHFIDDVHQVRG